MAKFYGVIGFEDTQETQPGVFEPTITKRNYSGDLIRISKRNESGDKINDDISISNQISIIADKYAYNHIYGMKYVKYMGANWKITDVEIQHPRLILSIGGLYNGYEDSAS
jgi:hypothetical protein